MNWPEIELDPVARLRALAAGLPHVALAEHVFDAPFDAVWGIVGDLENGVPRFEFGVRDLTITARDGDQLELVSRDPIGLKTSFRAVLRPGWCVMHARSADIGMAAAATSDGRTRFAHFEGIRWLGRLARPLLLRSVRSDFNRIDRLLADIG
jgi:hypothetical protein